MSFEDYKIGSKSGSSRDKIKMPRKFGAKQRRQVFKKQLLECNEVREVINGPKRNVYKVQTDSGSKLIWTHYSKNFNFWGGGVQKTEKLRAYSAELIHVFLGQQTNEYYIVSDDELSSDDFYMPLQNKSGNDQWKLEAQGNKGRNREILESNHTDLCSCFK